MSNMTEYKDRIAVHPGYYIKEIIDELGLTQEDFAKRLDTTPKNLSYLVRGEQKLSIDIAVRLSRMLDTSVQYWLNLQNAYDTRMAEFKADEELQKEYNTYKYLDYKYFRENFNLPDLPRKTKEQIEAVRKFLKVATLTVFEKRDMAVSFRSAATDVSVANIIKANVMVQIAINEAMAMDAPKFDKQKFAEAVEYALTLTTNHKEFYPLIFKTFFEAGVVFIILPNLSGSKINGATKKIGNSVMLMVSDRCLSADSFWFTLFHEIGHVLNGDYGISFESECGEREEAANKYAEDKLIPLEKFQDFIKKDIFTLDSIVKFAKEIDRDPGIILGRLQKMELIDYNDWTLQSLRHRYKVKISEQ